MRDYLVKVIRRSCDLPGCRKMFKVQRFWQKYCCPAHRRLDWERRNPRMPKGDR